MSGWVWKLVMKNVTSQNDSKYTSYIKTTWSVEKTGSYLELTSSITRKLSNVGKFKCPLQVMDETY